MNTRTETISRRESIKNVQARNAKKYAESPAEKKQIKKELLKVIQGMTAMHPDSRFEAIRRDEPLVGESPLFEALLMLQ